MAVKFYQEEKMKKTTILCFAFLFVISSMAIGHETGMKNCGMGMKGMAMQGKACGAVQCPLCGPDREVKVTDIKDGVQITITSKTPAVVKEIQAQSKACAEMKCKISGTKGSAAAANKDVKPGKPAGNPDEIVQCPVMGTKFKKKDAYAVYEYKGKTYYLCCKMCVEPFTTDPEKYVRD
jgi:YHS domain-containing protein